MIVQLYTTNPPGADFSSAFSTVVDFAVGVGRLLKHAVLVNLLAIA